MATRKLLLIMIVCVIGNTVQSQQKLRLAGNWEFLKQDIGSVWEAVRPLIKDNPENYPLWSKVSLPHCVNAEDGVTPGVNYHRGPAWYRTQLHVNNPYTNGKTLLHFEGAGQKTEVYIYTTKVATHVGGYDEWMADITEAVAAFKKTETCIKQFKGKVPLIIRCDNSRDLEMIPSGLSDFNIYGGIYRHLNIVYTPSLSIDKVFAFAQVDKEGKAGNVDVKLRLYNPSNATGATVLVKLISPEGKVLQQIQKQLTDIKGDISITNFNVQKPLLWHPSKPHLYGIEVVVISSNDTSVQSEKIGFRNFEFVTKGPFMLNGQRLLLKGTQRHEDHAGVGAAMTDKMMLAEMLMIKEMGANFIRLGHYQQSRYILELCDSLGILVWEEIPWCRGGLGGAVYQVQAKRMLTNMIEQHYNHPSAIIWGLGNENDWPGDFAEFDKEKIITFMKELNTLSHKLDSSRKTAIRRCEFCSDIVDLYSPTIWAGWYKGVYTDYAKLTKEGFDKVNHFLHAEWGGDSHAGRHDDKHDKVIQQFLNSHDTAAFNNAIKGAKDGDWSETYICNLFDWHLKEQETMPWLAGTAQWVFKDFATPVRPDNPLPYVNQKGVVQRDFTKKEGYYVFQSYWADKPMAHIYGHSWPVRWGKEGEEKMVKVYSNCSEVDLFVNGKSYGVKKRNSQDFPAAGLRWNVVFSKGSNTIKVLAKKGKAVVEDEVSFQYQTEQWGKPAKLVLSKINAGNVTGAVEVKLLDDNNILCLDAANLVQFKIAGDGVLMESQGTSTGSSTIQLYNGRAVIKIKDNSGKNVVSVSSQGLPTAFINL